MQVSDRRVERRIADAKPIATALHLVLGLFSGCIENRTNLRERNATRPATATWTSRCRLSSEQDERPRNDAAAKHAIELIDASRGRTCGDISTSAYVAVDDVENCEKRLVAPAAAGVSARSSMSEFHAPHSAQRPIHFGA